MQLEQQAGQLWGGGVAARIDARITADPGDAGTESAPVFHLSRHDPAPAPDPDDTLLTMFLTAVDTGTSEDRSRTAAFERWALTSSAVAVRVRGDEAPELVVDRMMASASLVAVNTAGALIDERTCRVGLRSSIFGGRYSRDGVLLTMTSETPDAPVELFPSLLYAWLSWWRQRDRARHAPQTPPPPRRDSADINDFAGEVAAWIERAAEVNRSGPAPEVNVPLPPESLDLIEDGHRYTVHLSDFELTTWPDLPPAQDRGL